jgi:hypothetical protein
VTGICALLGLPRKLARNPSEMSEKAGKEGMRIQPFMRPLLIRPIRREYPATSAARIAVRRRTGGICRAAFDQFNQIYLEIGCGPRVQMVGAGRPLGEGTKNLMTLLTK